MCRSPPVLGGGDPRRTGDQSEVPASDDGSQGRRAGSDQSAGDPHSGGGSTTQAEWSWDQSAASTGPDGGERWQSANAGADAAGDRRGSWSTAADPSGSTRGRDPWTDSDPWCNGYHRGDWDNPCRWHPHPRDNWENLTYWNEQWEATDRHDGRARRQPPQADGRDGLLRHNDPPDQRQGWTEDWQRGGPGRARQPDPDLRRGDFWGEDCEDDRWRPDYGGTGKAWDEAQPQDNYGGRGWEPIPGRQRNPGGGYGSGKAYGRPSERLSVPTFSAEGLSVPRVGAVLGPRGGPHRQGVLGLLPQDEKEARSDDQGVQRGVRQAFRPLAGGWLQPATGGGGVDVPGPLAARGVSGVELARLGGQSLRLASSPAGGDFARQRSEKTMGDSQHKESENQLRERDLPRGRLRARRVPGDEGIPEEVAEAWVTYQSAKDRYRTQQRARGYNGDGGDKGTKGNPPDGEKDRGEGRDPGREAKLKMMKAKSFCSGCGRRGHWHRDDACPLNQGGGAAGKAEGRTHDAAMTTVLPAEIFALRHVADLVGVTDTACARTVAGTHWLQAYTDKLAELGQRPALQRESEAYRFGTGKIHYSSFYVVVNFELGGYILQVRTSIITGDIPLLLSKTVLGKMGMVFDVENGSADF